MDLVVGPASVRPEDEMSWSGVANLTALAEVLPESCMRFAKTRLPPKRASQVAFSARDRGGLFYRIKHPSGSLLPQEVVTLQQLN